jgi:hypothetical protein
VQAALDSGFTNIAFTTDIQGSGTGTAAITNLAAGTTYWVRVGSLNWDGDANYTASVSTRTLIPIQTSGTITGNGLSLSVNPVGVPVTNIQLVIPPATLPTGIAVTLNTTVSYFLPSAVSNEASLTQVSPSLGFTIDAAGMQPVKELVVVLTYDPLQLPIGKAARDIQLARYDTASSQWTLLPTTVDTTQNRITARINHFSLFAPFFVSAGGDLSNVNIFPVPWEPGTDNANLNAAALTISNLPASSSVKITALNGALVWSGVSGTNGVLTWDGKNRFSRPVGSGTYLILIENGGAKTVRRAVLLR